MGGDSRAKKWLLIAFGLLLLAVTVATAFLVHYAISAGNNDSLIKPPAVVGLRFIAIAHSCHVPKWSATPSHNRTTVPLWHLVNHGVRIVIGGRSQSSELAHDL